jgi:CPA2 family monovalent cation:H+ antiporter-2
MEFWHLIMEIVLLLGVAFVFGFFAQWLKQSAIIGYLIAGALIGPIMFSRDAVSSVAELGVSLLLFSIGLEFSFRRLKNMGALALGGGTLQVLVTLMVFGFIFLLKYPSNTAVALGAMVALSSTAVVLRVLVDRTEIDSIRGRNALGILLMQDIAVVPLFLLVAVLSYGGAVGDILIQVAKTFAAAIGLIIAFYLFFHHFIPRVLLTRGLFANRELVVLLTIVVALGSTWLPRIRIFSSRHDACGITVCNTNSFRYRIAAYTFCHYFFYFYRDAGKSALVYRKLVAGASLARNRFFGKNRPHLHYLSDF